MSEKLKVKHLNTETSLGFNYIKLLFYMFILSVIVLGVYSILSLIKAVIAAFVISYLLNPIVVYGEQKKIPRNYVIFIIFLVVTVLMTAIVFLAIAFFPTAQEIGNLRNSILSLVTDSESFLRSKFEYVNWDKFFKSMIAQINQTSILTKRLPGLVSNIAGISSLIVIIPFCVISFLAKGRELRKGFLSLIPNKYFELTFVTISEANNIIGSYIRGIVVESFFIGTLTSMGFFLVGFPVEIALITGFIVGIFNAIPYIGPLLGGAIGIVMFLLEIIPSYNISVIGITPSILNIVIIIILVQVLDNVYFKPSILGKSVNLPPIVVLLGVMAGSNLFGFIGMIFAIPVIAILKVLIMTLYKQLKGFQLLSDNLFSVVTKKGEIAEK